MSILTATATAALIVAAGGAYIATPFLLSTSANSNLLYTKVPEGKGKIIAKGKSFHRAILSFRGYHLNERGKPHFDENEPEWEVLPNKPGKNYETRPQYTRSFGLFWVGIPGMREVYKYDFVWNEYRTNLEGGRDVWHREEETEVFVANDFSYVMVIEDAKTRDMLPVRAEFVIIVRITNPYKALFESNDWRTQLESYVDRIGRNFIGTFTYDQLRSETDEGKNCEKENFSIPIQKLTLCLPEEEECGLDEKDRRGLKGHIGVTIKAANLESIVLSGAAAAENERLSLAAYTADRNAETVRTGANAAAYDTVVRAGATALETRMKARAEAVAITARLRAMETNQPLSEKILVTEAMGQGTTFVVPSALVDAIGTIGKPASTKP